MLPMLSFHAFGAAVFLTVSPQWIAASASGLPGWRTQDASATLAFRRPIGREFSRQFSYKQNPESGVRVDEKRSAHERPVHTPCIAPASQRTESVFAIDFHLVIPVIPCDEPARRPARRRHGKTSVGAAMRDS
ncbi:hypothetical protein [Burkholderia ubonensis]|uniref:hypothetical protein n=1 Tax=Burkholderia ubonensis TaxID=101571 RepID=UPI0012F70AD5|nr:hypothetical protein [Burkholderia ubonensis]